MSDRVKQRMSGRNVAELTTLGVSVAIIAGLAGALVYRAFQPHDSYLIIEARALAAAAEQAGERYVVPIEVSNEGERTATKVALEITVAGGADTTAGDASSGGGESYDVDVEYLAGRSRRRLYVYLDRPPGSAPIEARVVHYSLD